MSESIRAYHEHLPILTDTLIRNGNLSLMLLDISPFSAIEEEYGIQTYASVRQQIFSLLQEQSGKEFRKEDILTLEEPGGLRILLFLVPRNQSTGISYTNLKSLRLRLKSALIPKLLRTSMPYLATSPRISIGFAKGIYNPLMDPSHTVLRIIREALEESIWEYQTAEREILHKLRELILNEDLITLYQPIVDLEQETPIAYEALSRGNVGSGFQSADELYDAAIKNRLLVELDRVCRKRCLLFSKRLPTNVKVFINTLPATIRDPEFQGRHLIHTLEQACITPDRIVIEITEKMVIDNLSLFQDAMTYFTELGMSLAVDDVGSGYSGLETIARLKPSYLKLDMSLVRGVHASPVNREILKGISSLSRGIGAKIIAEGIEKPEELKVIKDIGIEYGQGYLLGRPDTMSDSSKE
jgi:EAL domain-containing protein (putative c-di-GMP-specific phosphodiesterase class I)